MTTRSRISSKRPFDPQILAEFFSALPDVLQSFVYFEKQYQQRKPRRHMDEQREVSLQCLPGSGAKDLSLTRERRRPRHAFGSRSTRRRDEFEHEHVLKYCDCDYRQRKQKNALENRNHSILYHSPFTPRIRDCSMPRGFEFPQELKPYAGDSDPQSFLDGYLQQMRIRDAPDEFATKILPLYLTGNAQRWFNQLQDRSIDSYKQLAKLLAHSILLQQHNDP